MRSARPPTGWAVRWQRAAWFLGGLLVFLAIWETVGRLSSPIFLAPVSKVWRAFWELGLAHWWSALDVTLRETGTGLGIAVVLGLVTGVLVGRSRVASSVLDPYINALYATPRIAFLPLIIAWLGIEFSSKVAFVVLLAVFPILINVSSSLSYIDDKVIEVFMLMAPKRRLSGVAGLRDWIRMRLAYARFVFVPAIAPGLMSGLRLGVGAAFLGAVLGEMFTEQTGIGGLLRIYGDRFETDKLLAAIVVIAVTATLILSLFQVVEKEMVKWKGVDAVKWR